MPTTAQAPVGHERGTRAYRRLGAAMWCAGLATFVLVYCVQALLPAFADEFGVSSSAASLALSATTGTLALAIVPLSAVAESWGRARVMTIALAASAVLGLLAPLAPTFGALVAVRALQGVALAALPALSMAHVTREVAPRWLGGAVGLLIAGNTIGGLSGRLVAGAVAELGGWRVALAVIGGLSLLCTVAFRLLLPPPVAPTPPRVRLRELGRPLRAQPADPGLRCLFGIAFLLMGAFVTVYNYLGFRLLAPPFDLPAALTGLVFLGYLAGTWSSTGAGRLGDRWGRRRVLWAAVLVAVAGAWATLPDALPAVLAGLLVVTVGFFGAHSVASSWVGRRASVLPDGSPAVASSLYLFAYYLGSSVGGAVGGVAYDLGGWPAVVAYVTALLSGALALALRLRRVAALV
ncbi:MAG TPA: MFS transporter [Pseudonocardia sp.]|jgi:YNFM family putative membrane transporter|uniref:MFS transporter n=1 Tax=Pseudonocardia sp. TaxID=60912 RepID=UPI002B4B5EAB|nr:MFS transporter [Pseudonocardia sp.]HLU53930.1 MFS transporter [Pseudonocardia sp.]